MAWISEYVQSTCLILRKMIVKWRLYVLDLIRHSFTTGKKGFKTSVAGDFNAEVGPAEDDDDFDVVGKSPIGKRSERGEWLLLWAELHGLVLTNTFWGTTFDELWTFRPTSKELDYILVDKSMQADVTFCRVAPWLDTGSDHRALEMQLTIKAAHKPQTGRRIPAWGPRINTASFSSIADARLDASWDTSADASSKATLLERILVDSARASSAKIPPKTHVSQLNGEISNMIQARRALRAQSNLSKEEKQQARLDLTQRIRRSIRKKTRQERSTQIERIIRYFRGLKNIPTPSGAKVKHHIAMIKDSNGHEHRSQEAIAEVFAHFYEELYASKLDIPSHSPATASLAPDISMDELEQGLTAMKNGKCRDESGVVAEMLKNAEVNACKNAFLDLFNDVLRLDCTPPASWMCTRLIVLFKKGEPELPQNYRPISILPILYKLFARIICTRIQPAIVDAQSPDQAAYRKGYSTEDHLVTLTLLLEKASAWNFDLWFGLVDFEKAFDTVEHEALWKVLRSFGVAECYINLLVKLYNHQTAVVAAGTNSRIFKLSRGVKQGDPVSSLLFIAIMEACFRVLKTRWNNLNRRRVRQYYVIVIDLPDDPLTKLRFADDVLLVALSKQDAVQKSLD